MALLGSKVGNGKQARPLAAQVRAIVSSRTAEMRTPLEVDAAPFRPPATLACVRACAELTTAADVLRMSSAACCTSRRAAARLVELPVTRTASTCELRTLLSTRAIVSGQSTLPASNSRMPALSQFIVPRTNRLARRIAGNDAIVPGNGKRQTAHAQRPPGNGAGGLWHGHCGATQHAATYTGGTTKTSRRPLIGTQRSRTRNATQRDAQCARAISTTCGADERARAPHSGAEPRACASVRRCATGS